MNYIFQSPEEARKIGLSEEEGLEVLDEVRREMKDEGRH
jgi:hypothetical protein